MGKVVLVTGGAQGIGWQLAVANLRQAADFFSVRCDVAREAPARRIADPDTGPVQKLRPHGAAVTAQNFVIDGGMTKKMIYV